MSDSERKIFPVETVLALVSGKEDADVREIAGYITGRSMVCPKMAKSVAAFAGAWLARLYPKFADMVYDGSEAWELFVNRCAAQLGDKISLPPMDGRIKESCLAALDAMDKAFAEVDALKAEVAKQAAEIEALKPLEGALEAAKKQADQLDAQLKAQKKDMGALRRQAAGLGHRGSQAPCLPRPQGRVSLPAQVPHLTESPDSGCFPAVKAREIRHCHLFQSNFL